MDLEWMEEDDQDEEEEEEKEEKEERSRPTTPKWWRPPIPPETYMWEEIRRKRKKGGYPWTLLDKDDSLYDEDDNLYEPVNPPPLYGSGSRYMSKDQTDTGSLDGRMLDIPPDIEILTSEGLDGLDQPDPHDKGVDGDKEWHHFHHDDEQNQPAKATFTAGLRKERRHKHSHSKGAEGSSMRPLTNKSITFAPESNPGGTTEEAPAQEVPTAEPGPSRVGPLDQLKAKAEQAAGQVKQRISKISIPVRPKFNNWTGIKLAKKKPKEKRKAEDVAEDMEEEDQQVPDEERQEPLAKRKLEEFETTIEKVPEPEIVDVQQEVSAKQKAADKAAIKAEEKAKKEKEQAEEKARKEKELAEEKARVQKEQAEEKARKEKEQAEEKARKEKEHAEEKARKEKEQEEIKKAKAEEKLQKEKAKEEQKRLKAEEKLQKQEEAKRLKLEAELKKAAEQEELKRLKAEEEDLKAMQAQVEEERRNREAEEGDVEMEDAEGGQEENTGSRSRKGKKKMYRPNLPQLPHLPNLPQLPTLPQIDLKKRFIRHKSPQSRPSPKHAKKRMGLENQLSSQYSDELRSRELEMEEENEERLREPQIFITQASIETESEVPTDYSRTGASVRSDELEEEVEEALPLTKQQQGKEKLEKIGKQLKGFGIKSKAIASQKSKDLGQKMKVLGKDIQKFGVKVNEKCQATIEEIKAKQEAARNRGKKEEGYDIEGEEAEMELEVEGREEMEDIEETEPRTTFRFRRRTEEQIEQEQKKSSSQGVNLNFNETETRGEAPAVSEDDGKFARCQLLGRADRDWESPLDLAQSRDASEEPFSGNVSSRDSPPGSSMASSSIMQVRRQGVLEEIDSDEFFLRERGISEGEDEEEVNRFLVEELRQAFRPTMANALAGFDLPTPPSRPTRTPRKPPRKDKDRGSPNFQTFPPERPKRKQTPGYVSSYMHEHGDEEDEESAQRDEQNEEREVPHKEETIEERNRATREKLTLFDQEDEDEGSYEPVSDEPAKPERTKRKKPKVPETNQAFYYNTIAANEWMREVEEQIMDTEVALLEDQRQPAAPKRERRRSDRSANLGPGEGDINYADEEDRDKEMESVAESTLREDQPLTQAESEGKINESEIDLDDNLDYVDEAGYAIVHKDKEPPRTTPRKKKRGSNGGGSKGNSLKRKDQQSDTSGSGPLFFSLPRYTPRTFHIVPPTRPHRTYSTLRPKRPPRNKSKSNQNLVQNSPPPRRDPDEPRPSTAIGIMQGRPLPPPPRPERSPAPLNDLDQTSIERAVGVRHYANFEDESAEREVVEEVFTATNIPMLGRTAEDEEHEVSSLLANSDINVAVQTDPVQGDDYDLNNTTSFEEEDSSRIDKLRNSDSRIPSDDQEQELPETKSSPPPPQENVNKETEVPSKSQSIPDPVKESSPQITILSEPTHTEQIPVPAELPQSPQPEQVATPPPAPVIAPPAPAPVTPPSAPAPVTAPPAPVAAPPEPITAPPPPAPAPPAPPAPTPEPVIVQPQFIFPTRLHLEELEVDFLRVNDLSAHSITVDHLNAPHLEVTSLTSTGPLTVDRIQAQTLNSDQVNCNNLSSDTVDLPSIPPPSFYQLASPESVVQEEKAVPQELSLETEEQEDNENECSCPEDIIIGQFTLRSAEQLLASLTSARREPEVEESEAPVLEEEFVNQPQSLSSEPIESDTVSTEEGRRERSATPVLSEPDSVSPVLNIQPDPIVPVRNIQPESVTPVRNIQPERVSPVRTLQPEPISPVRTLQPEPVSPVRTLQPEPVSPVRTLQPEPVSPVRTLQPETVSPVQSESATPTVSVQSEPAASIPTRPARRSITPASTSAVGPDPENEDIIQLSTRLCRALVKATVRALQAMADYIDTATTDDPTKAEEQKANMQVLLCIVLVLVAGMILTTRSGPPTPKWEFYMPPPDL